MNNTVPVKRIRKQEGEEKRRDERTKGTVVKWKQKDNALSKTLKTKVKHGWIQKGLCKIERTARRLYRINTLVYTDPYYHLMWKKGTNFIYTA